MKAINYLTFFALMLASTSATAAPTKITDNDGQLVGIKNVNVDDMLFNVSFVEGTCFHVFDGCAANGFAFQSLSMAQAATNVFDRSNIRSIA